MLAAEFRRIQPELSAWIDISRWRYPLAVTLTCKKAFRDGLGYKRRVAENECHNNLHHVMNVVNHRILGPAQSKKRQIPLFPVLEQDADRRFHYHAIIDVPEGVDARFVQILQCTWGGSRVGYREMDFQIADEGWVQYILKARSKVRYLDAMDVGNIVLPTSRPLIAKAGLCQPYPSLCLGDPIKRWIDLLRALKNVQADSRNRVLF